MNELLYTVRIRNRAGWGMVRNISWNKAVKVAGQHILDGGEAEIYDHNGHRVKPTMEVQPNVRRAEAGYAYLGILIALLLAMTVIHLVIGKQPIASVPWLDAPVFEEKK